MEVDDEALEAILSKLGVGAAAQKGQGQQQGQGGAAVAQQATRDGRAVFGPEPPPAAGGGGGGSGRDSRRPGTGATGAR